jgi:thioredoxin reductase (NADPH)
VTSYLAGKALSETKVPSMVATHSSRVIILGSGPAGLSAAIYAARAGMAPIVVQGIQPGGQLTTTTDVENYPGFRDVIQGPWLMEEMQAQAEHVGTQMMWDHIVEVDFSRRPFRLIGDGGTVYSGDALVIATGAQAKWLGLPSEEKLKGKGVSACATCDGFFYRGKKVAVIGGGNTAVEEALYLTNHSHDVTLIHRRDTLRAEKILQERLFANPKIKVLWNREVAEFVGDGEPEGLVALNLRDTRTGAIERLDVEGGFVAIGHSPATELFRDKLELDSDGYIEVEPGSTRTSIPGVFACGDVMDKVYRQAVTAAGTGCMAALDAERFLAEADFETSVEAA